MILNRLLIENSKNGNLAEVSRLLERGANARTCRNSPIREASMRGYAPIVDILIQHGACPFIHDFICLRYAARSGYVDVAELILERGENSTTRMWNDTSCYMMHSKLWEAISIAVVYGHVEFLRMLERRGFRGFSRIGNLNIEKLLNNSVYYKNSNQPFLETLKFLLERGLVIRDDPHGYTRLNFLQLFGVEIPKFTEEIIGMINIILVHKE